MTFEIAPLSELRERQSVKWQKYGPDVLPLFVAEMDYPVAEPIKQAMIERIAADDVGYAMAPGPIGEAFAGFADRHWGWQVRPEYVRTTTDVSVAIVETLRRVISPGDGVVITPPIYPPFFELLPESGATTVEVPLLDDGSTYELDIDGIDRAFRDGAKAILIANPHNPSGALFERLAELAEVAQRHGAVVVSDEIHGPLTHGETPFTPFLSISDAARAVGVTVTSASKSFNLAGAKCALMVAASEPMAAVLDGMWEEVTTRTSILGLHANIAAFEQGDPWLADALDHIRTSADLLERLVAEHLPGVHYRRSGATYLAWLDFRDTDWGDDPTIRAMEAGVALHPGPMFGKQGAGFARLNLACSADVLTEAISRLG